MYFMSKYMHEKRFRKIVKINPYLTQKYPKKRLFLIIKINDSDHFDLALGFYKVKIFQILKRGLKVLCLNCKDKSRWNAFFPDRCETEN